MRNRSLHSGIVISTILFVAFTLCPTESGAETLRRVGIVSTVKINVSDAEAHAISKDLAMVLRKEFAVDVVSGAESERRLPPGGLPDDCVADSACRNDLGRRLQVDELLLLVIVRVGDRIQVDPTWSNVASGEVYSREAIVITKAKPAQKAFADSVDLLMPHLQPRGQSSNPATSGENGTSANAAQGSATPSDEQVNLGLTNGASNADSRGRHFTTGVWVAGGVSAGAFVAATVFALQAKSKHDELSDLGCDQMCPKDKVDSLRTTSLTSDVLFGTAIAAGATAGILYYFSDGDVKADEGLSFSVGPQAAGIRWGATF